MRPLTLFALVATALACDGSTPLSVPGDPNLVQSSNAPVNSITGGGKVDVTSVWPGAVDATISLGARVNGEGVATGELQAHFSVPDEKVHMEITCLSVNGNEAWIGGTVTHSHPSGNLLGNVYIVRFQDNEQGADAAPDRMSVFRSGGLPGPARCLNRPSGSPEFDLLFPFVAGNVQIR